MKTHKNQVPNVDINPQRSTNQQPGDQSQTEDVNNYLGSNLLTMPQLELNEDDPLSDDNIRQLNNLLNKIKQTLIICENIWDTTRKNFKLTADIMNKLHAYNEQHKTPRPDDLPEGDAWDEYNGFDNISYDEVVDIFGRSDHCMIGVDISQTKDRIKTAVQDFGNYMEILKDYNETERNYRQLIEMKEDQEMLKLKAIADNEQDPDARARLLKSIDEYYYRKCIGFMRTPLDEFSRTKIINAFGDSNAIDYLIKRSREKLKQINVTQQFILEISQFEKRFLPERYHALSNMTLLFMMNKIVYSKCNDPKSTDYTDVIAAVMAFDGVIRNTLSDTNRNMILDNITVMLDSIIDDIYAKYYPGKAIIPKETKEDKTNDTINS